MFLSSLCLPPRTIRFIRGENVNKIRRNV
jgi:hypothetical protein